MRNEYWMILLSAGCVFAVRRLGKGEFEGWSLRSRGCSSMLRERLRLGERSETMFGKVFCLFALA